MKIARERIQHHKTLIEKVRREVAIDSINIGKVTEDQAQSHQIESESRNVIEKK